MIVLVYERRVRLHVEVTATDSVGHPLPGCSELEAGPEGFKQNRNVSENKRVAKM